MPDVVQLGRRVKSKYPGAYDDIPDGVLGQKVKAKFPGAYDDFTDTTYTPPPPAPERSAYQALSGGLAQAGGTLAQAGLNIADAIGSAAGGDFGPLGNLAESAGRGALKFVSAFDPAGNAYEAESAIQDPRIAELQRRREQRQGQTPAGQYVQRRNAQLAAEAAGDKSLTNRIARGAGRFIGEVAPAVATGVLTGGSAPAIAATTALQSAGTPENIVPSALAGAAPIPAGQIVKAGLNGIRRIFGKGAAQIIEAEALPAATALERQAVPEASPVVQNAMQRFEQEVARIKTLPPGQQAAEMEAAIQNIGQQTRGTPTPTATESMVQSGYPRNMQAPLMRMPDEPLGAITGTRAGQEAVEQATIRPAAEAAPMQGRQVGRVVTVGDKTYRLNPEQEARWVVEVDEPLANATRRAQSFGPEDAAKIRKGTAMRIAGVKREIVGALTDKERAAIAAREATNYKGKPVEVDGQPGTVQGTAFGRVKVKLDNGSEVTVPPSSVTARGPASVAPMEVGPPPLEADLGPQSFGVRAAPDLPYSESVGPSASAPLDLNATVAQAADAVPRPALQRAKDELLGLLGASKSLRSTGDASYPLRQGALLLLRPLQWRQAAKVWAANFKAFRTKNFDAIKEAIDTHPLAGRMEAAGLKPFPQAGEEAFAKRAGSKISEVVQKAPILKQSEQSYTAAAATQRVQAFEQYAKLIDKAGLSPEEALKADKAAAEWINIATGRGSLGKRIDRAFEALNFAFFSPRYIASRLNVFNPAMYIRNASSPGGRVVLKQQMSDLMQFASVAATTMYLAKQAGADVGLNPKSPDFGKIRFGNWHYDLGAGLTQVMRLIYRVGEDIGRAGRGEKPKPGQTATDIAQTFLSYKLSPPAGVFRDFINQRTVDRKPFTAGGAVRDLVAPMQWADFVEAYQKEAWGGVLKASPGFPGVGVQNYESPPVQAAVERAQPLFTELQRLGKTVSELKRRGEGDKKEPDDIFNRRVQQFGQNYTLYGLKLLENERYKTASDDTKAKALEALNTRAKILTTRDMAFPELELDANTILDSVQSAEERKQERVRQRGF